MCVAACVNEIELKEWPKDQISDRDKTAATIESLIEQNSFEAAVPHATELVKQATEDFGETPSTVPYILLAARVLYHEGYDPEAERLYRLALSIVTDYDVGSPKREELYYLIKLYEAQGREAEAGSLYSQYLQILGATAPSNFDYALALQSYASFLRRNRRRVEAEGVEAHARSIASTCCPCREGLELCTCETSLVHAKSFEYAWASLLKGNYSRANSVWRRLADLGSAKSAYNVGVSYANGNGVERDAVAAAEWFQLSAISGYAEAQIALGHMFQTGLGVRQDHVKAATWFVQAARRGYRPAYARVALAYENGWGVVQDPKEGQRWRERYDDSVDVNTEDVRTEVTRPEEAAAHSFCRSSKSVGAFFYVGPVYETDGGCEQGDAALSNAEFLGRLAEWTWFQ